MKFYKIFVVIALCASIFTNFYLLSKLNNLENSINSISYNQSQVMNSVNAQTSNIRSVINDMKKEQSWVSPISVDIESTDIKTGEVEVNFQWQVKELLDNSKVVFNYKQSNEKDYTTANAVEKTNGLFEAAIPFEVTIEPEWRVEIIDRSKGAEAREERAIRESIIEEKKMNTQSSINYFISVTHDGTTKSSDINVNHIGHLGIEYYGYLETFINISQDKHYSVLVSGSPFHSQTSTTLKEVYLKKYIDGKLVDEEKLTASNMNEDMPYGDNVPTFHTDPSKEKLDHNSLVVKVTYSDGASFEREIYFN